MNTNNSEIRTLIESAENGDVKAQVALARRYYEGIGVEQNFREMDKWVRKAAEQGYAPAQRNLGLCYYFGIGVPQDYTETVKWLRMAAEQEYVFAQHELGECYYEGSGVPQDYSEAVKWYRMAAEQGYYDAQNQLGDCYYEGNGVPQDYTEAIKWYRMAAEQGNDHAQAQLGDCYYYGYGVLQDYLKAVKWYRMAAEQGNDHAQAQLNAWPILNIEPYIINLMLGDESDIDDVMQRLDESHLVDSKLFSHDKSPYIHFLCEQHAIDKYPIVPTFERDYYGSEISTLYTIEEGVLYTLIIDGQPNIVWEMYNVKYPTSVFRCTNEDYKEVRKLIICYIMSHNDINEKHHSSKGSVFNLDGKSRMIAHDDFESWKKQLMQPGCVMTENTNNDEEENLCRDKYITHVEIEKEGEWIDDTYSGYTIQAYAFVEVKYNVLHDGEEKNLITCTFKTSKFLEGVYIDVINPDWYFFEPDEKNLPCFEELKKIDFYAQGVPTDGNGLSDDVIGRALSKALYAYGIDWEDGDFECTKLFSSNMPCGPLPEL